MTRTVIFDFDGTIALGEGPVEAYARAVESLAGVNGLGDAITEARQRLADDAEAYRDGYDAVATAARAAGVSELALSEAYQRSREMLATPDAPVMAASGLVDFLRRLRPHATLKLVTNAPETRVPEALAHLGVGDAFDECVCSAGKPDGLTPHVAAALSQGPVLSVGDIDEFDLAPARALGADTALVGAAATNLDHGATFAAERLEQLYADIEMWVAASAPITDAPSGV